MRRDCTESHRVNHCDLVQWIDSTEDLESLERCRYLWLALANRAAERLDGPIYSRRERCSLTASWFVIMAGLGCFWIAFFSWLAG